MQDINVIHRRNRLLTILIWIFITLGLVSNLSAEGPGDSARALLITGGLMGASSLCCTLKKWLPQLFISSDSYCSNEHPS
ncbi:hypothetical protein [Paenibacillus favisporus]|uniref:hypothetical protein n=1 Tax=Paenibacillus favisporus TaxID=221028 RepID=UPI003D26E9DC